MYKLLKDSLKIRRYLLVTILVIQFISVILSTLLPYMNGMFVDKKIRISFENKDTEIYKELIQSLIELSFIKVAELKDELTIGQDVLIYDYFY